MSTVEKLSAGRYLVDGNRGELIVALNMQKDFVVWNVLEEVYEDSYSSLVALSTFDEAVDFATRYLDEVRH